MLNDHVAVDAAVSWIKQWVAAGETGEHVGQRAQRLHRQAQDYRARVDRSELAVHEYSAQNKIGSLEHQETIVREKLSTTSDELTRAETARIAAENEAASDFAVRAARKALAG